MVKIAHSAASVVDGATAPMLLKVVRSGNVQPLKLVIHRIAMHEITKAYDMFGNAAKEDALRVAPTNVGRL
jgi:alcohol dehydrogenase